MEIILWLITKLRYRQSYIGYLARISNSMIGKKCRIFRQARIVNSTLGFNTHISCESIVRNSDIGENVGIAERAIVGVYNRRNKRTVIGNNVMIGTGAIVMEGVKIGHNAWIGAMSVIRSNVPDNAVVNGNPAKVHRIQKDKKVMG